MKLLSKIFTKNEFQPKSFDIFFNNLFFIRLYLFKNIKNLSFNLKGKLLDLGCGSKPYKNLFINNEYIGLEIDKSKNTKADHFYNGKKFPFDDNYFNSFFSSEVFANIYNYKEILKEIKRVLKPGSMGLITSPFCWSEYDAPYDYYRFTKYGLKKIIEDSGFEIIEVKTSGNSLICSIQMFTFYISQNFSNINLVTKICSNLLVIIPLNTFGLFLNFILKKDYSYYFNTLILFRKN